MALVIHKQGCNCKDCDQKYLDDASGNSIVGHFVTSLVETANTVPLTRFPPSQFFKTTKILQNGGL